MMSLEKLIQAVLTAPPAVRNQLEAVLSGRDGSDKNGKKDTRLVTISGAARMLDLGRNCIYALIESGRLDTVDINGARRITMRSLNEFIDGQRPANEKTEAIIAANKARYARARKRGGAE